eukprot:scaffold54537_cov27-Tisochrysis_lutea.AAC.3
MSGGGGAAGGWWLTRRRFAASCCAILFLLAPIAAQSRASRSLQRRWSRWRKRSRRKRPRERRRGRNLGRRGVHVHEATDARPQGASFVSPSTQSRSLMRTTHRNLRGVHANHALGSPEGSENGHEPRKVDELVRRRRTLTPPRLSRRRAGSLVQRRVVGDIRRIDAGLERPQPLVGAPTSGGASPSAASTASLLARAASSSRRRVRITSAASHARMASVAPKAARTLPPPDDETASTSDGSSSTNA